MNDVLTSFAAGLLYGPEYRPVDDAVASRRLDLVPERCLDPFVETCLDPAFPWSWSSWTASGRPARIRWKRGWSPSW